MLSTSNRWPSGIFCVVQSYKDELAHVPLTSCRSCVCTFCKLGTAAITLGLKQRICSVHDLPVTPHAVVSHACPTCSTR